MLVNNLKPASEEQSLRRSAGLPPLGPIVGRIVRVWISIPINDGKEVLPHIIESRIDGYRYAENSIEIELSCAYDWLGEDIDFLVFNYEGSEKWSRYYAEAEWIDCTVCVIDEPITENPAPPTATVVQVSNPDTLSIGALCFYDCIPENGIYCSPMDLSLGRFYVRNSEKDFIIEARNDGSWNRASYTTPRRDPKNIVHFLGLYENV